MTIKNKVNLGGILLSAGIFALDMFIELGVAGGVPYIAVILLGLLANNKKYFIVTGVSGVLLTITGFLLSPTGGEMWKVVLNRFYAVAAITATAYILYKFVLTRDQLNQTKDFLDDRNKELNTIIENQYFLSSIIEHTHQAVIGKDLTGNIISWNKGAEILYGYKAEDVIGKNISILFPKDRENEITVILAKIKTNIKIDNFETIRLRKDGTPINMSLTISPIKNSSGDIIGASAIGMDITLEKIREQALKEAKIKAESANKAKSNFLANMSHEIRTPMNAILGYAQVLSRDDSLNEDQKESIDTINRSGNHLLGLINDILDISKIESGKIDLKMVDFDLGILSNDLKKLFKVRGIEKKLILEIDHCTEGDFFVHGDESKLRQVLINLIGNAVKFTDSGKVGFKFSKEEKEHRILFEIMDTGKGIPPEAHQSIFEPFKQDREGLNKGGTGLGLTISNKHVVKMGGELKVESQVSKGSRFYFSIPLHPAKGLMDNLHGKYKDVLSIKNGYKVKALVVDDVKENRNVLTRFLEDINVVVAKGNNGEEALDRVKTEDPQIVFMDIHMPVMDGVEAFKEIKKRYPDKDVKLVCITASAFGEQLNEYMQMGFDAFISKPFKTEEILSVFEKLLNVEFNYKTNTEEVLEPVCKDLDWPALRIPDELKSRICDHAKLYNISQIESDAEELKILDGGKAKPLAEYLMKCLKTYDMEAIINSISKLS